VNIIHIAAECAPLAKVGGLGDVVAALTDGLAREGHSVELFLPDYSALDRGSLERVERGVLQRLTIGARSFEYSIALARQSGSSVVFRLVSCPELFDLPGIYSGDADEPWRYALLTRVALQMAESRQRATHIVHCHDWHAALAAALLRRSPRGGGLAGARSVLTLHNLAYQGIFAPQVGREMGLGELVSDGRLNLLESGIRAADLVTTVSPRYAVEIRTAAHGMGLETLLSGLGERLVGVLNGVDPHQWSPSRNARLPATYSAQDLAGKRTNRHELLRRSGLEAADETPILAIVSRLVEQKGFDLFGEGFAELLERRDAVLVVLGTGEPVYEELFTELQRAQPTRVAFFREFNADLAHLIEAGSDIFLMPSRFEPCGLNQMYSMLYGTVPVVHHTGGLADTVLPFNRDTDKGTGLVFFEYLPEAFFAAVEEAIALFAEPVLWRRLMHSGMLQDFSWERAVSRYEELYENLRARLQ